MGLRNVPEDRPVALSGVVAARPGQVSSIEIAAGEVVDMTVLAFSAGEDVSEMAYPGDTVYLCLAGAALIARSEDRIVVREGEALRVAAGVPHAVAGADGCAFTILQVNALG